MSIQNSKRIKKTPFHYLNCTNSDSLRYRSLETVYLWSIASVITRDRVMLHISHAVYLIYQDRPRRGGVIMPLREGSRTQTATQLCKVAFSTRLEFGNLIVCTTNLMRQVPSQRFITNVTAPDTCYCLYFLWNSTSAYRACSMSRVSQKNAFYIIVRLVGKSSVLCIIS
jgi:hypothetical protein